MRPVWRYSGTMSSPLDATGWQARALCARHGDPDLWFSHDTNTARGICSACPVRAECLDSALTGELPVSGVWAGYTITQLADLRSARVTAEGGPRCKNCAATFTPRQFGQLYCSPVCVRIARTRSNRQSRQRRREAGQPDNRQARKDNRVNHRSNRKEDAA